VVAGRCFGRGISISRLGTSTSRWKDSQWRTASRSGVPTTATPSGLDQSCREDFGRRPRRYGELEPVDQRPRTFRARCSRSTPALAHQDGLQAAGEEGDEDVHLDTPLVVVENRANHEVVPKVFKLDRDELDVLFLGRGSHGSKSVILSGGWPRSSLKRSKGFRIRTDRCDA
jgi:hypothetical protein